VTRILFPRRGRLAAGDPGTDVQPASVAAILTWLGQADPDEDAAEYHPPLDVVETAAAIDIVADLPGVPPEAVRVVFTGDLVIIAGHKRPAGCRHADAFHLAERTFGRFASAVHVDGAFDVNRARAVLHGGELRVTLPRISERRRRDIAIPVERA
jgi:HSP20 family protein